MYCTGEGLSITIHHIGYPINTSPYVINTLLYLQIGPIAESLTTPTPAVPRPSGSLEESLSEGEKNEENEVKSHKAHAADLYLSGTGISYWTVFIFICFHCPTWTELNRLSLFSRVILTFAPTDRALGSELPKEPQSIHSSSTLLPTP